MAQYLILNTQKEPGITVLYIRPTDFRFLVVIIVFNKYKNIESQRRSRLLIKSAHVPTDLQLWVI